jgi:ribosomal protein S18 acetylase RimI-like enzyme
MRLAKPSDIDSLLHLFKACFPVHTIFEKDVEQIRRYLHLSLSKRWIIMKMEGKEPIGAVMVRRIGGVAPHGVFRINHLGVLEEHRKKGMGKRLMIEAETLIHSFEFETTKVEVQFSKDKMWLKDFYQKLGYDQEGILASHYRSGEKVVIMGKELERKEL